MKKNLLLICFLFLLSPLVSSAQTPRAKQRTLALTHVTVIDTTGGPTEPEMTVVIRGDRIAAVGKSGKVRVPPGSEVVDASGKFVIPGLWDMNAFWYEKDYSPIFIANGVTGLRVVLGYAEQHEFRKEIEAGQLLGPRMMIASRWFEGPNDVDPSFIPVGNQEEANRAIAKARRYGADFIEVGWGQGLPRQAYFALAKEAKEEGIPFEGHVPRFSVTVEEASNAGQKSIDALLPYSADVGILAACSTKEAELLKAWQKASATGPNFRARVQRALDTYDSQKAEAFFALLRANHTWVTPILIAWRNDIFFNDSALASDPRLKYMSPRKRSQLNEERNELSKTRSPEDMAVRKAAYQKYFEIVGAMHRRGVQLLAGTMGDEGAITVPGFSLHDELVLLVQAGLTPLEALQTATLNPARFLGREHDFGTVAPGKMADLVLLDANPLEDISNTSKIEAVVYQGKLYPRASLDAILAKIESLASKKSIGDVLETTIQRKGVEAAIRQYRELKSTQADVYDFDDQYELAQGGGGGIGVGEKLLIANKFQDAIKIYKLNAEAFPGWWWNYDSLGDAYAAAGEKELAIKNYKKSLQLDPAQTYAAIKLKQLNSQ